jgi:hypothetical protein
LEKAGFNIFRAETFASKHILFGGLGKKTTMESKSFDVLSKENVCDIEKRISMVDKFRPTKCVSFHKGGTLFSNAVNMNLLEIDDTNKLWRSFHSYNFKVYNYSDILNVELLVDNETETSSGLGGALLGGALFGGTGAVLGGVLTDGSMTTCNSLGIKITLNDINCPIAYIPFIDETSSLTGRFTISDEYRAKVTLAQECMSLFDIICEQNRESKALLRENNSIHISIPDEIAKYKNLHDSGVISAEEFDNAKNKLLGNKPSTVSSPLVISQETATNLESIVLCQNCGTRMTSKKIRKRSRRSIIAGIGVFLVAFLGTGWIMALLMVAGATLFGLGLKGKETSDGQCSDCKKELSENATPEKPIMGWIKDWKKEWYRQWWVLTIMAAFLVVIVNRGYILISGISANMVEPRIPVASSTIEESFRNSRGRPETIETEIAMTDIAFRGIDENTVPLAALDLKLLQKESKTGEEVEYTYTVIGTLKKTSTDPEESYFDFSVVFIDEFGRHIINKRTDTMPSRNSGTLLANGSTYHFELEITSWDLRRSSSINPPVAVEFMEIEEVSKAKFIRNTLDKAIENIGNEHFNDAENRATLALRLEPDNTEALSLLDNISVKRQEKADREAAEQATPSISPLPESTISTPEQASVSESAEESSHWERDSATGGMRLLPPGTSDTSGSLPNGQSESSSTNTSVGLTREQERYVKDAKEQILVLIHSIEDLLVHLQSANLFNDRWNRDLSSKLSVIRGNIHWLREINAPSGMDDLEIKIAIAASSSHP